ncbi:penicillin acylase family protein [Limibaculum sp. M0105]|uniref:Penicillin acylase family protein n=1 Tax=Thermohalobaculum xanthum TaxID=2753746 RepID=A0A8J7M8E5_9RHOB|nr:penicillin acylase family protein [Thermohalobaculum xanthum]MBK0400206.1 penicillin acylase family protein [Thermohalobaculum xanthum]
MNAILRWLLRGLALVAALVGLGAALGAYLVTRSLPDPNATVSLEGLDAPVSVIRDANAVPHIRAASARDAAFALGVVHAQDRLWQMEVARRAAQGRLSAILGERTVALDRLVKVLDIYGHARRSVDEQTPETQEALAAYAAGVNAWIRHVDREALGRGAPEFFLFGEEGLSPWTEADSLAVLKMMALRLSAAARSEVRRGRFLLSLPPERVRDILPDYPGPAVTTPPRFAELFDGARFAGLPAPRHDDPLLSLLGPVDRPESAGASNVWAVDGSRSATGKPLLASDPHLWLSAPSLWYLADIQGGDLAVIGGTLPGTPLVLIGRNRTLGWGMSTTTADDQDLYIERVNPDDPGSYLSPDGWQPFSSRRIRIDVRGSEPIVETVLETRNGPVLSHDMLGVDAITPEGHVAALRWTALETPDRTMSAMMALMRATDAGEIEAAAAMALAPAQNVIFSDGRDIGMVVAGALPRRRADSPSQGRVPSPGWLAETEWQGLRPARENPRILAPATGAVANANNRITEAAFPDNISFDWDAPYRIRRLEKELSARDFHSRDSFVALQNDAVSEMARAVLPLVARELWWRGPAETDVPSGEPARRARALELLANWSGDMDRHTPEPLIFSEWMRQLTRRLAADELGPLFGEIEGPRPLFVERVFLDIDGAGVWCDVDKTPEVETCAEMASLAFDDAMARLTRDYGTNIDGWRWGAAHLAEQKHTPLGYLAPIGLLFSVTHETSGGDYTILRGQSSGKGSEPFANIHASGLRVVYDFADLDRSLMIISTGQSGHPFSRHYDDLGDLWARGDMISMSMMDDEAQAGALGTMTLLPQE